MKYFPNMRCQKFFVIITITIWDRLMINNNIGLDALSVFVQCQIKQTVTLEVLWTENVPFLKLLTANFII